jgi:hypothetical protein
MAAVDFEARGFPIQSTYEHACLTHTVDYDWCTKGY